MTTSVLRGSSSVTLNNLGMERKTIQDGHISRHAESVLRSEPMHSAGQPKELKQRSIQRLNTLSADLVGFVSRLLIEQTFFQNHHIPQDLLLYLVNDLIQILVPKKKETVSVPKELSIMWKQLRGQKLTSEEEAYDKAPKELDVLGEILNGVKYSSMALMGKSLYTSMTSTLSQGLWSHIPAILGYTTATMLGSQGVALAVNKLLEAHRCLNTNQKALVQPWLNMVGRLALGLIPKVHASENGVHYHYPSTQTHTQTVTQNQTVTLRGDKLSVEKKGILDTPEGSFEGEYSAVFRLQKIYELTKEKIGIQVVNSAGKAVPVEFTRTIGEHGPIIQVTSSDKELQQHWTTYFVPRIAPPPAAQKQDSSFQTSQAKRTHDTTLFNWVGNIRDWTAQAASRLFSQVHDKSELEETRVLRALRESHVITIDQKGFQQILGSFSGRESGYEGYPAEFMQAYLMELIKQKISALETHIQCRPDNSLTFCRKKGGEVSDSVLITYYRNLIEHYEKAQEINREFKGSFEGFQKTYGEAIQKLKKGESFFFLGGWYDQNYSGNSHLVIYEVVKDNDGMFVFRIFNRGDGLEYYTKAVIEDHNHYLPFTEIMRISKEKIQDPLFLYGLQQLFKVSSEKKPWIAKDFYEVLLPVLEGEDSHRVYTADFLLREFQVGHCNYLSQTALLREHLGSQPLFERTLLEFEFKALVDFNSTSSLTGKENEDRRHLLRLGISQFEKTVKVAESHGIITPAERRFLGRQVAIIEGHVDRAESAYQKHLVNTAPTVPVEGVQNTEPMANFTLSVLKPVLKNNFPQIVKQTTIKTIQWRYSPETFFKDLQHYRQLISEANRAGNYIQAKEGFKAVFHKISLDWVKALPQEWETHPAAPWKTLTPEQAKETLGILADLSLQYIQSMCQDFKNLLSVEDFLPQAKVLTLADAIARRFKEAFQFELPHLYQQQMLYVIHGREASSGHLQDPIWAYERYLIRRYWDHIDPLPAPPSQKAKDQTSLLIDRDQQRFSFFGLDVYPAGIMQGQNDKDQFHRHLVVEARDQSGYGWWNRHLPHEWSDFNFAIDWVQKPNVREFIKHNYPQLAHLSPRTLAIYALAGRVEVPDGWPKQDQRINILPKEFFDLFEISYATNFLLTGKSYGHQDFEKRVQYVARLTEFQHTESKWKRPVWAVRYRLFGKEVDEDSYSESLVSIVEGPTINSPIRRLQEASGNSVGFENLYFTTEKWGSKKNAERGGIAGLRKRLGPHEYLVASQPQGKETRNPYETKELHALGSVPELQIQDTFGHYAQFPALLTKDQEWHFHQEWFRFSMQDESLLAEHLLKGPKHAARFCRKAARFFKTQYELNRLHKNRWKNGSLYFLRLNRFFANTVALVHRENPGSFPKNYVSPFMDSRTALRQMLRDPANSEEDKTLFRGELASSYRHEKLDAQAVEDILMAAFQAQLFPLGFVTQAKDHEIEANLLLNRGPIAEQMEEYLSEPERRNRCLNKVIKAFYPHAIDTEWTGHYYQYVSSDGSTMVDVLSGRLFKIGGMVASLPGEISARREFKHLFGERGYQGTQIYAQQADGSHFNIYDFLFDGVAHRVIAYGRELTFQRYQPENNSWIEHIPSWKNLGMAIQAITSEHHLWFNEGMPAPEIFAIDPRTQRKAYWVPLKKVGHNQYQMISAHMLDEHERPTSLVLGNIYGQKTPYDFLERFEDKAYIQLWQNQTTNEPVQIRFFRFNLSFDLTAIKGEKRWKCREVHGWVLAKQQHLSLLGDITPYLLLEKFNEKGQSQYAVLMPRQPMQPLKEIALFTHTNPERGELHHQQRYFIYDVVAERPFGQIILQPRTKESDEGRFFLAMMYLWKRTENSPNHYLQSMKLLRGHNSQIRPYNNEEREVLQWIATLSKGNKDQTPNGEAIHLLAYYFLLKDLYDFEGQQFKTDEIKQLKELYVYYNRNLDQVDEAFRLHEEEMSLIATFIEAQSKGASSLEGNSPVMHFSVKHLQHVDSDPNAYPQNGKDCYRVLTAGRYRTEQSQPSLFHADLVSAFESHYTLATSYYAKANDYRNFFKTVVGWDPDPTNKASVTELKSEFEKVLKLIARSTADADNRFIAALLYQAMKNPYSPSVTTVQYQLQRLVDNSKNLDSYEMRKELDWLWEQLTKPALEGLRTLSRGAVTKWSSQQQEWIGLDAPKVAKPKPVPPVPQEMQVTLWRKERSPFFQKSLLEGVEKVFTATGLPKETQLAKIKALEPLIKVLNFDDAPIQLTQAKKDLQAYAVETYQRRVTYAIADIDEAAKIQSNLQNEIERLEKDVEANMLSLQRLVNPFLPEKKYTISLENLLHWFHTANFEKLYRLNSNLSRKAVEKAFYQFKALLEDYVLRQRYIQLQDFIGQIIDSHEDISLSKQTQWLIEKWMTLAQETRNYSIETHPAYLLIEAKLGSFLRKDQRMNLERLEKRVARPNSTQSLGVAVQMKPGSGKTAALDPLQALRDADGDHFPIISMPAALMPDMVQELQKVLGNVGQFIEFMKFTRKSQFEVSHLKRLNTRFHYIEKGKKALFIDSESTLSLWLKFLEIVFDRESEAEQKSQFRRVWVTLFTKGIPTLDELDELLDIRRVSRYTWGQPQRLKEEVLSTEHDLFYFLTTSSKLKDKVYFPFVPSSRGEIFTEDSFKRLIYPVLLDSIVEGEVIASDQALVAFFRGLTVQEKSLVKQYIANADTEPANSYVDSQPMKVKNCLAILKEQLRSGLSQAIGRRCGEHYGPIPEYAKQSFRKHDSEVAVPYHSSHNPSVRAQFGTEMENLNFSLLMHLFQKIGKEMISKEIRAIQQEIPHEKLILDVDPEDTPAYKRFLRLCGSLSGLDPFNLGDDEINSIVKAVNEQPGVMIELISKYVLPSVKVYEKQLTTSGQLHSAFYGKGFSGDIWNYRSYPKMFHKIFHSNAQPETILTIWEKSSHAIPIIDLAPPVFSFDEQVRLAQVKAMVKALVSQFPDRVCGSFADVAGIFVNINDNEIIARAFLECCPSRDGAAFYNKDDLLVVAIRGQEKPVAYAVCGIAKNKLIAIWDQKRCRGSDIPLDLLMVALVSFGQHTMMHTLIQGAGRLRELHLGQVPLFVVLEEDRKIIVPVVEKLTGEKIGRKLLLKHLILYTLYIEAIRQAEDNHRSFKEKMEGILFRRIVEVICDFSIPDQKMEEILVKTDDLFVTVTPMNPYNVYGQSVQKRAKEMVVDSEIALFKQRKSWRAFTEDPLLRQRFPVEILLKELEALKNEEMDALAKMLDSPSRFNTEVTLEIEQDLDLNQLSQKQTQTQQQVEAETPDPTVDEARPPVLWKSKDLLSRNTYLPVSCNSLVPHTMQQLNLTHANSMGIPHVIQVRDTLAHYNFTAAFKDIFHPGLLATINLMPVYQRDNNRQPSFQPFGYYQDVITHVLLIKETESQCKAESQSKEGFHLIKPSKTKWEPLRVMLLDKEDVRQFTALLPQLRKQMQESVQSDVKICLYHLVMGVQEQGPDEVFEAEIEMQLRVQAKFISGVLNYSKTEQAYLKRWFLKRGVDRMFLLFQYVLANRAAPKEAFPTSSIAYVFRSLGKSI